MFEQMAGAAASSLHDQGNPAFENWMVDPARRHLASDVEELSFVSLAGGESRLPLVRWRGLPPGMGRVYSVWSHLHCFDTTAPGADDTCHSVQAIHAALADKNATMLHWPQLPADTLFYSQLQDCLVLHGLAARETKAYSRPFLDADLPGGAEAATARTSAKRVREFRRTRRRLEEMGRLELRTIDGVHDAGVWLPTFIEIEASGWKGSEGTAFAHRPREAAFLVEMATAAASEGRCIVYVLELAGKAIAMSINFRSGRKVWAFKTAYRDEL